MENNEFKLAHSEYYDITEIAKEHNPDYASYEKVFICNSHDFWIARIVSGYRMDMIEGGYVKSVGSLILERNKIDDPSLGNKLSNIHSNLDKDDFGNWDCFNIKSVEEGIYLLDDGKMVDDYPEIE